MVLRRHVAIYDRCSTCGLISVRSPTWLEEAYSSAISTLDVGLLDRAVSIAPVVELVVRATGSRGGRFLDWAGGYGTLTRLLRDRGLDFRHRDDFCENLFAQGFEGDLTTTYDLVTAVEVLEHLRDPVVELAAVARSTNLLLVTTVLLPDPAPAHDAWWYFAPHSGQHITFFTPSALRALAARLGFRVAVGRSTHLFYRDDVPVILRLLLARPKLLRHVAAMVHRLRPETLRESDFQLVLDAIDDAR